MLVYKFVKKSDRMCVIGVDFWARKLDRLFRRPSRAKRAEAASAAARVPGRVGAVTVLPIMGVVAESASSAVRDAAARAVRAKVEAADSLSPGDNGLLLAKPLVDDDSSNNLCKDRSLGEGRGEEP